MVLTFGQAKKICNFDSFIQIWTLQAWHPLSCQSSGGHRCFNPPRRRVPICIDKFKLKRHNQDKATARLYGVLGEQADSQGEAVQNETSALSEREATNSVISPEPCVCLCFLFLGQHRIEARNQSDYLKASVRQQVLSSAVLSWVQNRDQSKGALSTTPPECCTQTANPTRGRRFGNTSDHFLRYREKQIFKKCIYSSVQNYQIFSHYFGDKWDLKQMRRNRS